MAGGPIGDVTESAERFDRLKKKQSDWNGAGWGDPCLVRLSPFQPPLPNAFFLGPLLRIWQRRLLWKQLHEITDFAPGNLSPLISLLASLRLPVRACEIRPWAPLDAHRKDIMALARVGNWSRETIGSRDMEGREISRVFDLKRISRVWIWWEMAGCKRKQETWNQSSWNYLRELSKKEEERGW